MNFREFISEKDDANRFIAIEEKSNKFFISFTTSKPISYNSGVDAGLDKHLKRFKVLLIRTNATYGAQRVDVLIETKTKTTLDKISAPIKKAIEKYDDEHDVGEVDSINLVHPSDKLWKKGFGDFKSFFTDAEVSSFNYDNIKKSKFKKFVSLF